ncbi:Guanine nucleotide-binding protein alpha-4 subunit [Leucoagaricus sp. SymC.cos]|nr:Guanine nucleotide-binding protein alpha-4 subunit [Leucoagaricus sp. SymC.cos]
MLQSSDYDPLTAAMRPPPGETQEQREEREAAEAEALEVSNRIDAEIKASKQAMKRQKKPIRVLVLGQSMSGKTTTIKNFQMIYAQKSWAEERSSWHIVICFNLVRNVNTIADTLNEETTDSILTGRRSSLTEWHRSVLFRLSPLRRIENDLKAFLGAGSSESVEIHHPNRPNTSDGLRDSPSAQQISPPEDAKRPQEFCIWSSSGWKSILNQVKTRSAQGKESQVPRMVRAVLNSCKDDIHLLWNDPVVQSLLRAKHGRLEETPGFFLNDVDRILSTDYTPGDEDIVRARLRTTGVQEYRFTLDKGTGTSRDWVMYDVATAWIPYFPDITALIFLAPVSSFNERLMENPRINRLEDTFVLWKTVCSSKILANVQLILFMNKTDILRRKLEHGYQVKDHIPEFGGNKNEFSSVLEWFRRVFRKLFTDNNSSLNRKFIAHFTNVIDTKATQHTLQAGKFSTSRSESMALRYGCFKVQAAILRNDIEEAGLM